MNATNRFLQPRRLSGLEEFAWLTLTWGYVIAMAIAAAIAYFAGGTTWHYLLAVGAVVGVSVLSRLVYVLTHRQNRRRVVACGGCICPYCAHQLAPRADYIRCSECGKGYLVEEMRDYWERVYEVKLGAGQVVGSRES